MKHPFVLLASLILLFPASLGCAPLDRQQTTLFEDARLQPLADQAQHAPVPDPVLQEPHQPRMAHAVEEPPDVGTLRGADDTFLCTNPYGTTYNGPVVSLNKDWGYTRYQNRTGYQPRTIFDASSGKWKQQVKPTLLQDLPILIGAAGPPYHTPPRGGPPFCFKGGVVDGTNIVNETWCKMYVGHNTGVGAAGGDGDVTLDGIRIDNVFDGFGVSQSERFTIKNSWLTYNRDDAIENDHMRPGTIEDNLFDGIFVFISSVNQQSFPTGPSNLVQVKNNLIRMQAFPGPPLSGGSCSGGGRGFAVVFKYWDGDAPKVALHNNIIVIPDLEQSLSTADDLKEVKNKIVSCSGNRLIWSGRGTLDPDWAAMNNKFPGCFTISTDMSLYNAAKQNWINCHPKVGRVPGDPASDFSKCDPKTWGGGGTGAPSGGHLRALAPDPLSEPDGPGLQW
jgi:hypothetical protein